MFCLYCVLVMLPDRTLLGQRYGIKASVYGEGHTPGLVTLTHVSPKQLWEAGYYVVISIQ